MKRLLSHLTVLNLLLIIIAGLLFYHLYYYNPLRSAAIDENAFVSEGEKGKEAEKTVATTSTQDNTQKIDYSIILNRNLFHPERIIPPEKKAVVELPKPDFVLYGTLISGDASIAYLEDLKAQKTTPGRGRRQNALKIGQTMSGYTLKEIHEDRVVFMKDQERIEVRVLDNQAKKTRGLTPPAPTPQKPAPPTPPPPPTPVRK